MPPADAILSEHGVKLAWALAVGLIVSIIGGTLWVANVEETQEDLLKDMDLRPPPHELYRMMELVKMHEEKLKAPLWTLADSLAYQRQHKAEHLQSHELLHQLESHLKNRRLEADRLYAALLEQITRLYDLDAQHTARLRVLESALDIYRGPGIEPPTTEELKKELHP